VVLQVNGQKAPSQQHDKDCRLIDFDHELEEPIIVTTMKLKSKMAPLLFTIRDRPLQVLILVDNPTCADAKDAIGQAVNIQTAKSINPT
jgi:hypothetical protein